MYCKLCRAEADSEEICQVCSFTIDATEWILEMYSQGQPPDWVSDFVRELSFTFERDLRRAQGLFNVANEIIIVGFRDFPAGIIPILQLEQLADRPRSEVRDIISVLERAKIARLQGDSIVVEELGLRLVQIIPSGADLLSETYQEYVDEMRGALCVVLARELIEEWLNDETDRGRPRSYLLNMNRLSNYVAMNLPRPAPIEPEVDGAEFFVQPERRLQIGDAQLIKIMKDLLGLCGGPPRIINSVTAMPGGGFKVTLKDSVILFLERLRERQRERLRPRS